MPNRLETPQPGTLQTTNAPIFCDRFSMGKHYWTQRQHGNGDWLLIFTEGGAGNYHTAQGSFVARRGIAVLYAPGEYQYYSTNPEEGFWELTWVHFLPPPHWKAYLTWPVHQVGLRTLDLSQADSSADFQRALARMVQMSRRTIPKALDLAANALEEALLWAQTISDSAAGETSDERVRRAADYLSVNLKKPFQSQELATHCGLSISRLSHLFKAQTGVSPQQFHERQRLHHATQLLRLTSLSVTEVAQEVGFVDPFYFSNRFRRAFGKSPLRYRQVQAEKS